MAAQTSQDHITRPFQQPASPAFDAMYASTGRPSIPPERLLKATLLMAFYSVRSERLFCEQLDYNLLFRWFLDMDMTEPGFDHPIEVVRRCSPSVPGARFVRTESPPSRSEGGGGGEIAAPTTQVARRRLAQQPVKKRNAPNDTPPPDDPGNPTVDFRGEKRSNETHESSTDPEARLARKSNGTASKLSFSAHSLMENRNGLLVDFRVALATGTAERTVALAGC